MFHRGMWENAVRILKKRDELLKENPNMTVQEAVNKAYKEILENDS